MNNAANLLAVTSSDDWISIGGSSLFTGIRRGRGHHRIQRRRAAGLGGTNSTTEANVTNDFDMFMSMADSRVNLGSVSFLFIEN